MEIFRTTPDNPIVIVDKDEFDRIDTIAKLKEEDVEKLSEEKFLQYVKRCGIQMCLRINGVDRVLRQNVISDLNYDERVFPESVHEEVKHAIVDDITYYINNHFKHYKDDCKEIVKNEWNRYMNRYENKIKRWKYLFVFSLIVSIIECICLIN